VEPAASLVEPVARKRLWQIVRVRERHRIPACHRQGLEPTTGGGIVKGVYDERREAIPHREGQHHVGERRHRVRAVRVRGAPTDGGCSRSVFAIGAAYRSTARVAVLLDATV
jgi:hypothetical protein